MAASGNVLQLPCLILDFKNPRQKRIQLNENVLACASTSSIMELQVMG